ncbi:MAG TPA: flagellar biosynthesis protein FlhA, partial [Candidatus Hydrogenedens sp.]|nr:flagellar biosynthesis protein FlhA [Candidatus Hydrogenedens sp.]
IFVGIVIFIILVVIQFVVITRGATRISEVAARFTLDAMPGKQMGVDSDLNAGLITEEQARQRRRDIEREADFYGAMDGATKFVRGDAIAGLIITIVNISVGLVMGVLMNGMSLADAARIYTQLTIGDGLVSQIPALMISTAAGLVVTRTVSEENSLGADFTIQFSRYPRALGVAAGLLALFGIVPGMPFGPFIMVALVLGFIAYMSVQVQREKEVKAKQEEEISKKAKEKPESPTERAEALLTIDPIKVELGFALIKLADRSQGGDLLSRVQKIREQMAVQMGFVVPVVRIVDNLLLKPNQYCIKIREATVGSYEILPDHYLAMNPGIVDENIQGIETTEPAFGLPALWVTASQKEQAESAGYTVVEPSAVLATHLSEILSTHAGELLTREEVQRLLKRLKQTSPTVVDELVPNILSYGEVQKVLQNLLRERVSIRNLEVICEVLCDYGPRTKDTDVLTEYVRHALARTICAPLVDENNKLRIVTLSPSLEQEILDAVKRGEGGEYIPVSPQRSQQICENTAKAIQRLVLEGYEPIVVCTANVRRFLYRILERKLPKIRVLSYNEIDSSVKVEIEGQIEV